MSRATASSATTCRSPGRSRAAAWPRSPRRRPRTTGGSSTSTRRSTSCTRSTTAAQETAHNWGLEHVDETVDLMSPFNNGGYKEFVDSCENINHDTGAGVTQCGYIHEVYCPAGGGEQQNSH